HGGGGGSGGGGAGRERGAGSERRPAVAAAAAGRAAAPGAASHAVAKKPSSSRSESLSHSKEINEMYCNSSFVWAVPIGLEKMLNHISKNCITSKQINENVYCELIDNEGYLG
ncbi:Protein of unknown function, partial [Gryllus bimaculatus]